MLKRLALCAVLSFPLFGQQIDIRPIAERAIASGGNDFRLLLAAGRYADALKTLEQLPPNLVNVRWEIYAKAKSMEGTPFEDAFTQVFRERMKRLDDKAAYRVLYSLGTSPVALQNRLTSTVARFKDTSALTLAEASELAGAVVSVEAYTAFAPFIQRLSDEDDQRRYVISTATPVKTSTATVCAVIARPRTQAKLPALLNFTIYANPQANLNEARRAASNNFIGVVGLARGKGCSPGSSVPYEHDSEDAAALVDWIAGQPWSDGRVGMYGGSYEGGATWAAAKKMPKALKAIMDGAPVAPGLDVPMEENIFWNFIYPFPFYTTNNKTLDDATYNQSERWQRVDREYYVKGSAYRELDKIDGTPNPIFRTWVSHPSYDAYWQSMIPYGKEFARVSIPVLTTAGYYYGGPGAAVYYVRNHYKYRPNAEHYLVIGPYDHVRGHGGTISVLGTRTFTSLNGYDLEPNAHIDMPDLRYRWFNFVFGRGPKPEILADKINYFLVGANEWQHAPSIEAMSTRKLRIPVRGELVVNFADRSDVDAPSVGGNVIDKVVDTTNGLKFVSDPIAAPAQASGLFSGHLDFITNKKDFDFNIVLYELTPAGDYVLLAPFWTRASYNGHQSERRLLTPGKRQQLDFQAIRLMGRQLQPGSRIVAVLSIIKEVGRQLNYGTGKEVSDETMADVKEPLKVQWLEGSFIDAPLK